MNQTIGLVFSAGILASAFLGLAPLRADDDATSPPAPPGRDEVAMAVRGLSDPDFEARETAQRKLEAWGCEYPEMVLAAVSGTSADPEAEARRATLRSILSLAAPLPEFMFAAAGDVRLQQALKTLFSRPPSRQALTAVANVLPPECRDNRKEAAARAMEFFFTHEDPAIRRTAAEVAGRLECASSTGPLLARLADAEKDPDVIRATMNALSRLKQEGGKKEAVARTLEKCLTHREPQVRTQAVGMLGYLGCASSVGPLLKSLSGPADSEEEVDVVLVAMGALARMKAREAFPGIASLLDAEHPSIAAHAVWTVEQWAHQEWGAVVAGKWAEDSEEWKGEENPLSKAVKNARAWWEANKGNLDEALKVAEAAAAKDAAEAAERRAKPRPGPVVSGMAPWVEVPSDAEGEKGE